MDETERRNETVEEETNSNHREGQTQASGREGE